MAEEESFTCPRCGATSYHPKDIEFGYCGRCHDYTRGERLVLPRQRINREVRNPRRRTP